MPRRNVQDVLTLASGLGVLLLLGAGPGWGADAERDKQAGQRHAHASSGADPQSQSAERESAPDSDKKEKRPALIAALPDVALPRVVEAPEAGLRAVANTRFVALSGASVAGGVDAPGIDSAAAWRQLDARPPVAWQPVTDPDLPPAMPGRAELQCCLVPHGPPAR